MTTDRMLLDIIYNRIEQINSTNVYIVFDESKRIGLIDCETKEFISINSDRNIWNMADMCAYKYSGKYEPILINIILIPCSEYKTIMYDCIRHKIVGEFDELVTTIIEDNRLIVYGENNFDLINYTYYDLNKDELYSKTNINKEEIQQILNKLIGGYYNGN